MPKRKGKRKPSHKGQKRIGDKISLLRHEGVPEKQAVGAAYGMERSGRLGEGGAYHRATPKGSRESPFKKYKKKHHRKESRR